MKVMIVGAGIVGLSIARELLKRGVNVAVFDQGPIPNPISSSMDEHRITRHTYADLPGYGALMPLAFRAYDEVFADLGAEYYVPTGVVYVGREGHDPQARMAPELDALGVKHRALGLDELRQTLPQIKLDGLSNAFCAEGSGMLLAERIVRDLAAWVAAHGAEMHPFSTVEAIDTDAGTLVANGQTFGADVVVSATGAWVAELMPQYQGRLVSSRQMVLYLRAPAHLAPYWEKSPVIIDQGPSHGANILPPRAGTRLKLGDHKFSRAGSGSDHRAATEADLAPILASARRVLEGFEDYATIERKIGYYTVTGDERFVVEPAGSAAWLTSACSGHGFKLGALTAKIAAMAITGEISAEVAAQIAAARGDTAPIAALFER